MDRRLHIIIAMIIALLVAFAVIALAVIALTVTTMEMTKAESTRTEFAEIISQTDTAAIFATEDGHLFSADVGELLELHTKYIIVFDTNKTADRTDDVILSVSKLVK